MPSVAHYYNMAHQYVKQIISAALSEKIEPLKIVALLNQARIESGNFNKKISYSVWSISGYTNPWGMQYPRQTLKNRSNIIGFVTDKKGVKWSKYKNVYNSTLDRIYWERIKGIIPFDNPRQYYTELGKRGYFMPDGVDKGYEDAVVKLYNQNLLKDLEQIRIQSTNTISPIIIIAALIFLL